VTIGIVTTTIWIVTTTITVVTVTGKIVTSTILVCWGYINEPFCWGNKVNFSVILFFKNSSQDRPIHQVIFSTNNYQKKKCAEAILKHWYRSITFEKPQAWLIKTKNDKCISRIIHLEAQFSNNDRAKNLLAALPSPYESIFLESM